MWPRTDNGMLKTDKETFKEMAEIHPEMGPLKELKALIGGLNFKSIMAGSGGRSRTLISPFWIKTGRNASKDDEEKKNRGELRVRFMFGLSASLRSLIKPTEGKVLAYIDYAQGEFFIAAVLSKDPNMIEAYKSGIRIWLLQN
jgi:DNA polymerase-1